MTLPLKIILVFIVLGDWPRVCAIQVSEAMSSIKGSILRGVITYPVDILNSAPGSPTINPQARTWIVIHGWNSSRNNANIADVTSSLLLTRTNDQVLTLDWSEAAATGPLDPFAAEQAIPLVATWAATALNTFGFTGTNLNLIGHSFGSYIADEIAERIPGGVASIVALDPAENIFFGYNPNESVDFELHSLFSWAFYSSDIDLGVGNSGNEETPTTADEAFVVTGTTHGDIVFLFSWMVSNALATLHLFSLNSLLAGSPGPWVPDFYNYDGERDGGYEAVIKAGPDRRSAESIRFEPLPMLRISRGQNGIALSWTIGQVVFRVQSASHLRASSWIDVSAQVTQVESSNLIVVPAPSRQQFFRLTK